MARKKQIECQEQVWGRGVSYIKLKFMPIKIESLSLGLSISEGIMFKYALTFFLMKLVDILENVL